MDRQRMDEKTDIGTKIIGGWMDKRINGWTDKEMERLNDGQIGRWTMKSMYGWKKETGWMD